MKEPKENQSAWFEPTFRHSPSQANREILASMRRSIERHIEDDADQIHQRLRELESEWDIERLLETNAATLSLAGLSLGATVNRKFYILPAIMCGYFLQHGLQGLGLRWKSYVA